LTGITKRPMIIKSRVGVPMNSEGLEGFSVWHDWSSVTVNKAPMKTGVYAFRLAHAERIRRLKGESDIVYIGATRKGNRTLRDRLRQHLRPRTDMKDVGVRLQRVVLEVGPLEIAWRDFQSHTDAQWTEARLLAQFSDDHIEFPPLNQQETGKKLSDAVRVLRAMKPEDRAKVFAKVEEIKRQSNVTNSTSRQ